jgi:rhamnose utilization protein RhaD (predicted bifunctional aldolase and dehydrogenase)/NAD(P)-dependent dehydrogenase (short-subunit alcohol dehydrogenase family)
MMKSLWNEQDAAALHDDPLALRVYSSRLLGGDPSLVLHGGGNTSVKMTVPNFFGEPEEVLYVKGSGWDLGSIAAAGFAPVRLGVLLRLAQLETLSDSDMVQQQRAAMLNPNAPAPSVEAILHAIIPFKFVDHTHADAVVTVMNTPGGEERIKAIYGPNMLIVPYVMPGFILARTVYEMTRDIDWGKLDGILLMNHGVFTFADDAQSSYARHIAIVSQAEEYLAQQIGADLPAATAQAAPNPPLADLARLRRAVSQARGGACLAQLDAGVDSLAFANLPNVADIATRGVLTPDHVLRTKLVPLVVSGEMESEVARYAAEYQAYFERHASSYPYKLVPLDPAPRWAVWPGQGTLAFGRTLKEIVPVADIKRHTLRAIQRAEALGGWRALDAAEVFEVEYWELEQAKLGKGGNEPPLLGKIAIVTGAASGIGRACAEALAAQGAAVMALDINPATPELFKQPNIRGQLCDVTDSAALKAAVESAVRHFGGLDIIVCNAGMFPSSQLIEEMDSEAWSRSLDLNLTSHQRLMQHSIPYLKLGIDPAVVIIASKNVPAPGPGAGAYSVAKAGLAQLGRVAALELGKAGIRVNMLHPNAVFDTGIWTPEVLAKRAASYGISVEEYKTNNLLHTEVTSKDVAALVCAMAGPLFAKTTGAQLPIDGGNERVI